MKGQLSRRWPEKQIRDRMTCTNVMLPGVIFHFSLVLAFISCVSVVTQCRLSSVFTVTLQTSLRVPITNSDSV